MNTIGMNIYNQETLKVAQDNLTLEILLNKNKSNSSSDLSSTKKSNLDTAEFSDESLYLMKSDTTGSTGTSVNTALDENIDLQSYIDEATTKNEESVENAGSEIIARNDYSSLDDAYWVALSDKYTKLVSTAKQYSNPSDYIYDKYYDASSSWYAADLSDTERQTAYNYEMSVLNTGHIQCIDKNDSLFRNREDSAISPNELEIAHNRQMSNKQVSNILDENGITLSDDESCTFTVDPYSYYISVEGVSDELKEKMEKALNTGDNGKNLYSHIRTASSQDGTNSTQISETGLQKYNLYHQVYDLTGVDITTLTEKDGGYYTEDGENILNQVDEAIEQLSGVSSEGKYSLMNWISRLASSVSETGWNHIEDMPLSIYYSTNGLNDIDQEHGYGNASDWIQELYA